MKKSVNKPVNVYWKHRKNFNDKYEFMRSTIGKKKKIFLRSDAKYTLNDLKNILFEQYVDENNFRFFLNSHFGIGTSDGVVITEFKNEEGKACDIWEYSNEVLRNQSHQLNIYILTTDTIEPTYKKVFLKL